MHCHHSLVTSHLPLLPLLLSLSFSSFSDLWLTGELIESWVILYNLYASGRWQRWCYWSYMRKTGADSDHKVFSTAMRKCKCRRECWWFVRLRYDWNVDLSGETWYKGNEKDSDRRKLSIAQSKRNLHAVLPHKPGGTTELKCIVYLTVCECGMTRKGP